MHTVLIAAAAAPLSHHPPGHTQTTLERKAKHRQLFGSTDTATSSSTSTPSDPLSDPMFDRLPPAVRKALQEAQQLGPRTTPAQRLDLVPKSCPHCEWCRKGAVQETQGLMGVGSVCVFACAIASGIEWFLRLKIWGRCALTQP